MSPLFVFLGAIVAIMGWEMWSIKAIKILGPHFLTPLGYIGWSLIGSPMMDEVVNGFGLFIFILGLFLLGLGFLHTSEKDEPVALDEEDEEED